MTTIVRRKPFRYQRVRLARGTLRESLFRLGDVALTEFNTGTALIVNMDEVTPEQTIGILSHEAIHMAIMNFGTNEEKQAEMHALFDRATSLEFSLGPNGLDAREDFQ